MCWLLPPRRGEGCASAHAGRSTSRYLEPFAGLDGGVGTVLTLLEEPCGLWGT